jgi:hypothetical protein
MLGAIPIDTVVFIALVLIASFFRWISKEAEKAKQKSKQGDRLPAQPLRTEPREETDEQRVRRFLEALGQPTSSKPPLPATRRQTYQKPVVLPRVRSFGSPLPPLTTKPPELPRTVALPRQITQPPYEQKTFKPVAAVPNFEVHQPTAVAPPEPPPPITSPAEAYAIASHPKTAPKQIETDIISLLRSPSGLRDVVLLREIFGPPRSLQSLEF